VSGRPAWMDAALCRGLPTDLFFPAEGTRDDDPDIAAAKAVCWQCPVRRQCVAYALPDPAVHGVWGATTTDQRRAERTRRRQLRAG